MSMTRGGNLSICTSALFYSSGSIPLDRGYPWTDVNGEKNAQTANDGCLLCQVDSNLLGV
jgi:hypothetical protein